MNCPAATTSGQFNYPTTRRKIMRLAFMLFIGLMWMAPLHAEGTDNTMITKKAPTR
jgi:hypothetical protein